MKPVVIIGSGLAGYTLARELRKLDGERALHLLTRDDGAVYSKPMLSNALSKGKDAQALATASAADMAGQLNARIDTGIAVQSIDRDTRRLTTNRGDIAYGQLVLALGADPVALAIDGDAAARVLSVNDLGDYARFRDALAPGDHVAIMGAGLIGCEFANDLLANGYRVTVIDPAGQPLGRLLPAECATDLHQALEAAGIAWRFGNTVARIDTNGPACRLTLADGETFEADHVLSAVGLRPRTALAADAGLACARGIQVDRRLATADADIYALGDCAEVDGLVLPFVMPLMHAARALAKTLAGEPTDVRYPAMPVVVKTPACATVVSPPAPDADGQWVAERLAPGSTRARFVGATGQLLGFALTGTATGEKQALSKLLPAVLD